MGMGRAGLVGVVWVTVMVVVESAFRAAVAQHQFELVHGYAHMEGSTARRGEEGVSGEYYRTLREHDQRRLRRMLPEVVAFPITGDDDIYTTGYCTPLFDGVWCWGDGERPLRKGARCWLDCLKERNAVANVSSI